MLQESSAREPEESIPHSQRDSAETREAKEYPLNNPLYINNLIFNPRIINDPKNTKERFSKDLWADKEIKGIRQMPKFLEIFMNQKKKRMIIKNKGFNNYETAEQLQPQPKSEELEKNNKFFLENLSLRNKCKALKPPVNDEEIFDEWVKSIQNKNFVAWFIPLRDTGPKLHKLLISKATLAYLGYEPEEFTFEMEKYPEIVADFWSAESYKTIMLSYLNNLSNFISSEIKEDMSHEDCVKKSRISVKTEMLGKNGVSINTQMIMFMPTINTVCYEIERMKEGNDLRVEEAAEIRSNEIKKLNEETFHSLSRITKLPLDINPAFSSKICSYVVIKNDEEKNENRSLEEEMSSSYNG